DGRQLARPQRVRSGTPRYAERGVPRPRRARLAPPAALGPSDRPRHRGTRAPARHLGRRGLAVARERRLGREQAARPEREERARTAERAAHLPLHDDPDARHRQRADRGPHRRRPLRLDHAAAHGSVTPPALLPVDPARPAGADPRIRHREDQRRVPARRRDARDQDDPRVHEPADQSRDRGQLRRVQGPDRRDRRHRRERSEADPLEPVRLPVLRRPLPDVAGLPLREGRAAHERRTRPRLLAHPREPPRPVGDRRHARRAPAGRHRLRHVEARIRVDLLQAAVLGQLVREAADDRPLDRAARRARLGEVPRLELELRALPARRRPRRRRERQPERGQPRRARDVPRQVGAPAADRCVRSGLHHRTSTAVGWAADGRRLVSRVRPARGARRARAHSRQAGDWLRAHARGRHRRRVPRRADRRRRARAQGALRLAPRSVPARRRRRGRALARARGRRRPAPLQETLVGKPFDCRRANRRHAVFRLPRPSWSRPRRFHPSPRTAWTRATSRWKAPRPSPPAWTSGRSPCCRTRSPCSARRRDAGRAAAALPRTPRTSQGRPRSCRGTPRRDGRSGTCTRRSARSGKSTGRAYTASLSRVRFILPALVAAAALIVPASGAAHATLLATSPENGAVLDTPPTQVTVTFDDTIRVGSNNAVVANASRASALSGPAVAHGRTLVLPLEPHLSDGAYTARWSIVSDDGHREEGVIAFAVGAGSAPPQAVLGAAVPLTWSEVLFRTFYYLGLLAAAGAAFFGLLTRRTLGDRATKPLAQLLFF